MQTGIPFLEPCKKEGRQAHTCASMQIRNITERCMVPRQSRAILFRKAVSISSALFVLFSSCALTLACGGTAKDGFDGKYRYTGKLRSVMPLEEVPKRTVPDHIPKPDYATEGER